MQRNYGSLQDTSVTLKVIPCLFCMENVKTWCSRAGCRVGGDWEGSAMRLKSGSVVEVRYICTEASSPTPLPSSRLLIERGAYPWGTSSIIGTCYIRARFSSCPSYWMLIPQKQVEIVLPSLLTPNSTLELSLSKPIQMGPAVPQTSGFELILPMRLLAA
jgi:hypothetical protein